MLVFASQYKNKLEENVQNLKAQIAALEAGLASDASTAPQVSWRTTTTDDVKIYSSLNITILRLHVIEYV